MKKRLGAIPKGLEWISQTTDEQLTVLATKAEPATVPSVRQGLQDDLTRATFILQQEHLEKIKAYAYWERVQIKDVVEQMCEQFFEDKKIRSIPQRKK